MLHTLLVIIHVLICIVLAAVVLLQSSKGGGLAGAFGGAGGAPQQLLGSRGMTTLLHKVTIYCAVGFFVTSFLLFMTDPTGTQATSRSIVGEAAEKGEIDAPITENPLDAPIEAPATAPAGQQTDDSDDGEGGGN
jgi:preprotein translocase subunit SecG